MTNSNSMTAAKASHSSNTPIAVKIVLGNPQVDCRRFGICKMEALQDHARLDLLMPFRYVLALLVPEFPWAVTLFFSKPSMDAATQQLHFDEGFFRVETPFDLATIKSLPVAFGQGQIQAGMYAIQRVPGFFSVRMSVTPKFDSS
jgi:hypothetical protein